MKDTSVIPKGQYCYTWENDPNYNWENDPNGSSGFLPGKAKYCPYYGSKMMNGVEVPWCSLLSLGGTDNNWKAGDWEKVRESYPSEEAMDKELPLFLLWDSCKECGENFDESLIQ
jgi:hypothetical protein